MKRILAASAEAERFGQLHDSGDYESNEKIYDKIYSILDKYGDGNDPVHELYDRADEDDQQELMKLAEQIGKGNNEEVTKETVKQKYKDLYSKSEKGRTSSYEDGYLDALCDLADAYGIDLSK